MKTTRYSHRRWQITLGLLLFAAALILHGLHYLIFRDAYHLAVYFLGDLAFVPVDILVVAIILNRLLSSREKTARLSKLNMVVSVFFSELGRPLLAVFLGMDENSGDLSRIIKPSTDWDVKMFNRAREAVQKHEQKITGDPGAQDGYFSSMRDFLMSKRPFLLTLMENPNLLEHESFSDLLLAVFHLIDELLERKDFSACGEKDRQHLAGDANRAYRHLMLEWLTYLQHVKKEYPYLFSLSLRTNPFDPDAIAELR
ncbi:MAG: hypothetical protein E4H36_07810 [Spirochaetales bacterium]|nr:MAG: hypothetical protein E4H36_07810 [Spirochaetales bacterium]